MLIVNINNSMRNSPPNVFVLGNWTLSAIFLTVNGFLPQVTTNDGTSDVPVTRTYVQMSNGCIQGSYVEMPVRRNATRVFVELYGDHSNSKSGLTELEIFVEGKEVSDRYRIAHGNVLQTFSCLYLASLRH